jgi:hypothetical protein
MAFGRAAPFFPVASLAESMGVSLIEPGHCVRFGGCFGLVTGETGFCLHYHLVHTMIETDIALWGLEDEIVIFCGRIGMYGVLILGL